MRARFTLAITITTFALAQQPATPPANHIVVSALSLKDLPVLNAIPPSTKCAIPLIEVIPPKDKDFKILQTKPDLKSLAPMPQYKGLPPCPAK